VDFRKLEFARRIGLLSVLGVCALTQWTVAARAEDNASSPDPKLVTRQAAYHVRNGDTIDLVFDLCPEFNQTLTVSPDGQISLKAASNIQAAGLTLTELSTSIDVAYHAVLNNPHVALSLKSTDIEKPFFIATGQVTKPGKYDLSAGTTVLQAVTIAGGFTDGAKTSTVVLYRHIAEANYQPEVVDVKKLLAARDLTSDVFLRPGDMLYVPKSQYGKLKPFIPSANVFLNPLNY
jgi:polysaccharide biosynthesis/export protein